MTKFEDKLEKVPTKTIQHPVGDTKYYAAIHVKTLIAQADEEIANLKSQLQQQALPVVPECVADWIEYWKSSGRGFISIHRALTEGVNLPDFDKVHAWLSEYEKKYDKNGEEIFEDMNGVEPPNTTLFIRAWLDGYTVEKPQLFYLKSKLTNKYLMQHKVDCRFGEDDSKKESTYWQTKFTQAEIDSMQTGSYEQIEVEK